MFTLVREEKKGRKEKVGAAEPLRKNEPPSEQRGREGPYLSSRTLGRPSGQEAGRDEGASGSRKCQREGEPFQGEDAGSVVVGKKRKLNLWEVGTGPYCQLEN